MCSEEAFVFSDQSDGTVTPDNNVCAGVREGRCPTGPPTHRRVMCPGLELREMLGQGAETSARWRVKWQMTRRIYYTHALCCLSGGMSLYKETQRKTQQKWHTYVYMLMNTVKTVFNTPQRNKCKLNS